MKQTAGHDVFFMTIAHQCPAAAELGRLAERMMRNWAATILSLSILAASGAVLGSSVLLAQTDKGQAAESARQDDELRQQLSRLAEKEQTARTPGQLMFLAMFGGGGLLFAIIGTAIVRVSLAFRRDLARFVPATGQVIDYQTVKGVDTDGDKFTRHDPVITYQDADSVTHRAVISGASEVKFSVGEQIKVLYDPACFDRAHIVGFLPQTTSPGFGVAFIVLGGLFCLIGVCVWVSGMPVTMN
jgi:hypothetical protein